MKFSLKIRKLHPLITRFLFKIVVIDKSEETATSLVLVNSPPQIGHI